VKSEVERDSCTPQFKGHTDMIRYIYLTAVGLTPGGSIHRPHLLRFDVLISKPTSARDGVLREEIHLNVDGKKLIIDSCYLEICCSRLSVIQRALKATYSVQCGNSGSVPFIGSLSNRR
jgi:hypothetical protein